MTTTEAKDHLRLDAGFTVDDAYIGTLIPLVSELVQNHTNKMPLMELNYSCLRFIMIGATQI